MLIPAVARILPSVPLSALQSPVSLAGPERPSPGPRQSPTGAIPELEPNRIDHNQPTFRDTGTVDTPALRPNSLSLPVVLALPRLSRLSCSSR